MEDLKFNLQRFNEEGDGGTTEQDSTSNADASSNQDTMPRIAVKDGKLVFLDDDNELGYAGDDGSQEEDADNDDSAQGDENDDSDTTDQSEETADRKYIVTVRGEKVEVGLDELLGGYMRTADYTKSKQELKQEADRLRAYYASNPATPNPTQPVTPQDQMAAKKQEYMHLKNTVEAKVTEIMGEPFNSMDDEHLAVFTQEMADARMELMEQRNKYNQFQSTLQLHTQQPDWNEIDMFAGQVMASLPKGVGDAIETQIKQGNADVMNQFLTLVRQEYHKLNNPQANIKQPISTIPVQQKKQIPNRVEGAGSGADTNVVTTNFDGQKFGQMKNIYNKMDYLDKMGVFGAMQNLK